MGFLGYPSLQFDFKNFPVDLDHRIRDFLSSGCINLPFFTGFSGWIGLDLLCLKKANSIWVYFPGPHDLESTLHDIPITYPHDGPELEIL